MKSTRSCLLLACAAALIGLLLPTPLQAGLTFVEDASGRRSAGFRDLIQWTHSRLLFDKELKRVAIGQEKTLEVEILGGRELLVLAKNVGRTTLIVWYADGSSETYLFSVSEDLSVLRSALHDIHSGIRLEPAPDRPALVLRGKVPTVKYKVAAEAAARHYLGCASRAGPACRRRTRGRTCPPPCRWWWRPRTATAREATLCASTRRAWAATAGWR
ncbi:pilus assembly protein N-terminal domain-containing protein [Pseudomonas lalucatii]|nr:pilus assembly protein N-terminal domain-containing protein [Pseudomonas lalucatii]QVM86696.1 pilus assembly protein N-terminal domain-containing protein [Pseudomonas lalucatii]